MKITKVYTRSGDKGMTSLVAGVRVKKNCERLEAYGTVDELSSHLGMLAEMLRTCGHTNLLHQRRFVLHIQNCLFNVCTHLATDQSQTPLYPSAFLPKAEIEQVENYIDEMMNQLPEHQGFVLPGGCQAACQAHICRTVCRRAERRIYTLADTAEIAQEIVQYMNRLSDYLFVLAKIINFNMGVEEIVWQNVCK